LALRRKAPKRRDMFWWNISKGEVDPPDFEIVN
jgi:hypothetical protein